MSLTREEALVFRALKRTAVVLMLVRYLDRPVGEGDIAAILDMDPKTARAHLRSLASLGLLTRLHFHQGYQLTHAGRQMALPLEAVESQPDPALPAAADPGEFSGSTGSESPRDPLPADFPLGEAGGLHPASAAQGDPPEDSALSPLGLSEPGQPCPHHPGEFPGCLTLNTDPNKDISLHDAIISINHQPGKIPRSADPRPMQINTSPPDGFEERVEGLPAACPDSPGASPPDGLPTDPREVAELPTDDPRLVAGALAAVGVVLNARTRKLLGRITTDDVEAVYRDLVRKRKGSETGLLIYMLEKIADPEQPYLEFPENPWGYQRSIQSEANQEDLEEDAVCEAQAVEMAFDGPPEVERAWEMALGLIQKELPKVVFDTWLAPARPLVWEADKELLTVKVANASARDYLDERVKYLLLPYLAGILKSRGVSLAFVVR